MALALMKAPQVERGRRTRPAPARVARRGAASEASLDAPIVTVYRVPGGLFHHAWCHQPLEYHGRRAALEVDFYCLRCVEHVTLPEIVLPRIPVRAPLAQA